MLKGEKEHREEKKKTINTIDHQEKREQEPLFITWRAQNKR